MTEGGYNKYTRAELREPEHAPTHAELNDMLEAALGLICNAHQKTVDYVTTDDGASPGWAEAARRWIDAYPPNVMDAALEENRAQFS